jgi:hypothetical protein
MVLSSPIGGRLGYRIQPRYIIMFSTAVAAIGLYLYTGLDPRSGAWDVIYPLGIMAFGMGFGMAQRTNIVASAVPRHEIGIASSVLALARNIAGAFGIAIFSTLLNSSIKNYVLQTAQLSSFHGKTPADYGTFVSLISLKAQMDGYHTVFIASAAVVMVGAVLAYFIGDLKLKSDVKVHVEG